VSNWRVVSGWSGIGFVALQVLATILYAFGGLPPAIQDSAAQASYTARNASLLLTVAIVVAIGVMLFYSYVLGLRAVILAGGEETDRPAAAVWGAGIVLGGLMFITSALLAASALDASVQPQGILIRAFAELSVAVMGVAVIDVVLLLLTAARGTLMGTALPRWTGRLGQIAAILSLVSVLSLYGGTAAGDITFLVGFIPFLIYVVVTSIALLRMPAVAAATMAASRGRP